MSFMEKVSNFFGLEDEEYTNSYQTGQNKSVPPRQSSAAPVNKTVKSQPKKNHSHKLLTGRLFENQYKQNHNLKKTNASKFTYDKN